MALTPFGKAVRKARLDADVTLSDMASHFNVTSAFLSAVETGRKKVPNGFASQVESYFLLEGVKTPPLQPLADVSNETLSLEGLNPEHQMLVAGFARTAWNEINEDELDNLRRLLKTIGGR